MLNPKEISIKRIGKNWFEISSIKKETWNKRCMQETLKLVKTKIRELDDRLESLRHIELMIKKALKETKSYKPNN